MKEEQFLENQIICTGSPGYASAARRCDVSYSTQDWKPSASKQSEFFSHPNHRPKSNRPYLSHIWDVISCVVRRRYPANYTVLAICKVRVEGYSAAYLNAVRDLDA